MRRWWLWVALMLSLGVNVGILGTIAAHRFGQRPQPARQVDLPRSGQLPPLNTLADRLRLTGERRDRFLEVQREFFTEVTSRRIELATLRQELRRELTARQPDRGRIDRILERTGEATAALDGAFVANVLASRELLDRRQQRLYFRFLQRLRAGGEAPRHPGGR